MPPEEEKIELNGVKAFLYIFVTPRLPIQVFQLPQSCHNQPLLEETVSVWSLFLFTSLASYTEILTNGPQKITALDHRLDKRGNGCAKLVAKWTGRREVK